jgi:predicted GIY-YIG superfamily endonuclease
MKVWHVYELYNLLGSIEYVGETINTERRFREHTKSKTGKFYGRTDISMNIVKIFDNGKEAWDYQCELQKKYELITDGEIQSNTRIGKEHSIKTKLKISKSVSKSLTGKKLSEETKEKIRKSLLKYFETKNI